MKVKSSVNIVSYTEAEPGLLFAMGISGHTQLFLRVGKNKWGFGAVALTHPLKSEPAPTLMSNQMFTNCDVLALPTAVIIPKVDLSTIVAAPPDPEQRGAFIFRGGRRLVRCMREHGVYDVDVESGEINEGMGKDEFWVRAWAIHDRDDDDLKDEPIFAFSIGA